MFSSSCKKRPTLTPQVQLHVVLAHLEGQALAQGQELPLGARGDRQHVAPARGGGGPGPQSLDALAAQEKDAETLEVIKWALAEIARDPVETRQDPVPADLAEQVGKTAAESDKDGATDVAAGVKTDAKATDATSSADAKAADAKATAETKPAE